MNKQFVLTATNNKKDNNHIVNGHTCVDCIYNADGVCICYNDVEITYADAIACAQWMERKHKHKHKQ